MIIKLLDRDDTYLRNIEVYDAKHHQILNGEDTFEFKSVDLSIEEGQRIVFTKYTGEHFEFIVSRTELIHDNEGITLLVESENSFYETYGDYVEDRRITNGTATAAMQALFDNTRWTVGTVDNLGLKTANFYRKKVKEAFHKDLLETWKGEFKTRITISGNKISSRIIDLKARIGQDNGKRFVYDKDMSDISRTVSTDGLCTALYGYGKGEEVGDGYGRRLSFADINGGLAYVENTLAKNKYGYVKAGVRQNIYDSVEFDEVTDKALLKQLTLDELAVRSVPSVTYEAKVIDLRKYGFDFEGVGIGDTVNCIDKDIDLRVSARVIEYIDYIDNEDENEIVLGSYKKTIANNTDSDFINSFRSKSGVWDRSKILTDTGISASYIDGLIDELNAQANATGGWVWIKQGDGLLSINAETEALATEAVQIKGGKVRIASNKNPDGTWDWGTFIDGGRVVATYITAGMLQGGKVKFNLEDGTLLIGNSTTDYDLYWDGASLKIKGDNIDLTSNEAIQARVTRQQLISDPEIKNSITQAVTPAVVTSVRQSQEYQNDLAEAASSRDLRLVKNLIDGLTVTHNKLLIQINEIGETTEITTAKNSLISQLASINTIYSSILADSKVTDEEWTSLDAAIASYGTTSATLEKFIVQALYKEIGTLAQTTNESFQQMTPEYLWEKVSGTQTWTDAMSQKADLDSVGKTVDEKIVAYDNSTISNMKSTIQTIREKVIEDGELILDKTKNFTQDVNGLTIDGGGASALRLSDDMISFLMNGVTGDYWKNGWFYTKNVEVLETLRLPNHTLVTIGTSTAFRPTGR